MPDRLPERQQDASGPRPVAALSPVEALYARTDANVDGEFKGIFGSGGPEARAALESAAATEGRSAYARFRVDPDAFGAVVGNRERADIVGGALDALNYSKAYHAAQQEGRTPNVPSYNSASSSHITEPELTAGPCTYRDDSGQIVTENCYEENGRELSAVVKFQRNISVNSNLIILTPFVAPALAEPTPLGEIALGAAAGIIVGYGLYRGLTNFAPPEALPRGEHGAFIPDTNLPHTQLGTRPNGYRQTREWGEGSQTRNPIRDIDWTDHGRPQTHPNPHAHDWIPNPTGGTPRRGPSIPLPQVSPLTPNPR